MILLFCKLMANELELCVERGCFYCFINTNNQRKIFANKKRSCYEMEIKEMAIYFLFFFICTIFFERVVLVLYNRNTNLFKMMFEKNNFFHIFCYMETKSVR